jgi:hypothetical protein
LRTNLAAAQEMCRKSQAEQVSLQELYLASEKSTKDKDTAIKGLEEQINVLNAQVRMNNTKSINS